MDSYLSHHGILGQKWGVRRFQNEDGTLTPAGRERKMYRDRTVRAGKTKDAVDGIISTMTSDEKDKLAIDKEGYLSFEQGSSVCKRILKKHGDTPVAFFDVLDDGDTFQLSMGTRSGKDFRGKGYASKAASEGVAWMNKNYSKYGKKKAVWGVRVDNKASILIAEKNGFVIDKNSYSEDRKWVNYEKKFKHSLFAEDHLEHHGIPGQKWGVRRYQNEDGSLTPAGKIRYGNLNKGEREYVIDNNTFTRFSDKRERSVRNSSYVLSTKYDYRHYKEDAEDYKLGNKGKELYEITIKRHGNAKVAEASTTISDLMTELSKKDTKTREEQKALKTYRRLDKAGFFNEKLSVNDRYDVLLNTLSPKGIEHVDYLLKKATNKVGDKEDYAQKKRNALAEQAHNQVYANRDAFAAKYRDKGYSMIVDPEDYIYNYERPYIIVDKRKFTVSSTKKLKHSEGGLDMTYDELVHSIFSESPEDTDLEHHGILGQKWGKKNGPPYPLDENDHSASEKKLNKFTPSGVVAKYKDHKKKVQRQKALKKARATKAANAEAKKAAEEHEAAKQKALRSANAAEIMKYRDELTDAEMRDAVARIGWDETLRKKAKEQNPGKIEKAVKIVDKYGTMAGKVGDATASFTKMYNNIAKVLNTFTDSDWPTIGDSKNGNQNDSDKKPENSKPSRNKNNKKDRDKKNFDKVIREATRILGNAAKKVDEEESQKEAKSGAKGFKGEKWEKHDWTVDDKQSSGSSSNSSSSRKETFVDTKFEDVTPAQAEEVGRLAVERYLQLEDKRKG